MAHAKRRRREGSRRRDGDAVVEDGMVGCRVGGARLGGRAGSEAHSTPYFENHVWLAHFRCNQRGSREEDQAKRQGSVRGDCLARTGG